MMKLTKENYPANTRHNLESFVGWKFGTKYVTGRWKYRDRGRWKEVMWETQCSCGSRPTFVRPSELLSGLYRSCVHCSARKGANNPAYRGTVNIPMSYFSRLQRGLVRRTKTLSCELSIDDLQNLWNKSNGLCALSGLPISFTERTASIDRIDSSVGYTVENTQFVHKHINKMKMDLSEDLFKSLCASVTNWDRRTCDSEETYKEGSN